MMVEINNRLAAETQRILKNNRLSLRRAAYFTSLHYNVLQGMSQGKAPRYDQILHFAQVFHEDPVTWLEIAGFDDLVALIEAKPQQQRLDQPAPSHALLALCTRIAHLPESSRRYFEIAVLAFGDYLFARWHTHQLQERNPPEESAER